MPNPGWYDDPEDSTQLRWWSGNRWTDRRMPRAGSGSQETPRGGAGTPPPERGDSASLAPRPSAPRDPWAGSPSGGASSDWSTGSRSSAGNAASNWGASATSSQSQWPAPPRTFVESIKICLTKYVDGKGRASRSEYWYFALFSFIINIVTAGIGSLFLLLPSLTVSVRRLHDIGKSAWAFLWIFVPFVGPFVLIYYTVKPGEPQMNQFG
jgi:uncharacterized membrane protein YhaH (DUF805 family)